MSECSLAGRHQGRSRSSGLVYQSVAVRNSKGALWPSLQLSWWAYVVPAVLTQRKCMCKPKQNATLHALRHPLTDTCV